MMEWDFNISNAPRGHEEEKIKTIKGKDVVSKVFVPVKIIVACKCGTVTLSHWIPQQQRWNMLAKGEKPLAWLPWPEHPKAGA